MIDLFNYHRRESTVVNVGNTPLGGDNPVRIQSMTTTSTNDTEGSVKQTERIVAAGGEYVRLTTQGTREAENLKNIKAQLVAEGCDVPLIADIHFNARVADVAALYAEKVRINPGNYVDPARTFKKLEYTDEEYAEEIKKIDRRLVPFINICKENHTAVRIGVNHGSLSDRIMCRYGDTPEGMVESCMEFLRIFRRENFNDVCISIKASNTVVMVRTVRLLVAEMDKNDMHYPIHLGVTEAGEGEDGRIKSAVGSGALLSDGIGDTIRVSLTEEPEAEIPVAKYLVDYIGRKKDHVLIPGQAYEGFDYLHPERRETRAVGNIGGDNVPVVISSLLEGEDNFGELRPDYIYVGKNLPKTLVKDQRYILDYDPYEHLLAEGRLPENVYPIFPYNGTPFIARTKADIKFLVLQFGAPSEEYIPCLKYNPDVVVLCVSNHQNRLGDQRALVHEFMRNGIKNPVVFCQMYAHSAQEKSEFQLESAADMGALMLDGLTDGIWVMNQGSLCNRVIVETEYSILQAARLRTFKTEYISCPGCGRTMYDLPATIARIKAATKHLKGLKIGIMGCIVNGPGEMADADYGYVGAGPKKISLYKKKECIKRNIPEEDAVEQLLEFIENDRKKN